MEELVAAKPLSRIKFTSLEGMMEKIDLMILGNLILAIDSGQEYKSKYQVCLR